MFHFYLSTTEMRPIPVMENMGGVYETLPVFEVD
jgi:hypothetical protein